jgi:hypothetical protein
MENYEHTHFRLPVHYLSPWQNTVITFGSNKCQARKWQASIAVAKQTTAATTTTTTTKQQQQQQRFELKTLTFLCLKINCTQPIVQTNLHICYGKLRAHISVYQCIEQGHLWQRPGN